jgi:hypothetical protein
MMLTAPASSACATGNKDAIFYGTAAEAHVRRTSASFSGHFAGSVKRAHASITAAVITALSSMRRSADDDRQCIARCHCDRRFHHATASGRRARTHGRNPKLFDAIGNLEGLCDTDEMERFALCCQMAIGNGRSKRRDIASACNEQRGRQSKEQKPDWSG